MQDRIQIEKLYWEKAAEDKDVDSKYISDIPDAKFLQEIGERNGMVLDLGCGVGRLMQDGDFGIDISENMIEIARQRKPKCRFRVCNGRSIPYQDDYFDLVYSVLLFQHLHIDAVETYIDEVGRVLKSGGKFVFQFIEGYENEPFSQHHAWDNIYKVLVRNGFKFTAKRGKVHYQWTWVKAIKI